MKSILVMRGPCQLTRLEKVCMMAEFKARMACVPRAATLV